MTDNEPQKIEENSKENEAEEKLPEKAEGKKEKKTAVPRRKKKKEVKQIPSGRVYVQATYNNTLISVTDPRGNVLAWSSAGSNGFKGPKKATPYAASIVIKNLMEKIKPFSFREAHVFVKGIGLGREGAIRALHANGINILSIKDVTPIPHNGCRPAKVRRV